MTWRVVMIEQGDSLKLKLDNLLIKKEGLDYTIPLMDINTIIISNLNSVISTRLLDALTAYNISLIVCDYKHHPSGLFTGLNTHSRASKIIKGQLAWTDAFKDSTWKLIVEAKIKNQRSVLSLFSTNEESLLLMDSYINNIASGDITNREGHAAKIYFNTLFGKSFSRKQDDEIINICLNYIYTIVRAFFARLIVAYGYSGMIGIHHKSEYNNFNLVDDLMEPFRPICDKYVLSNIKPTAIFDLKTRYFLVDFLHTKIIYQGQNMLMVSAIEKYLQSFMRYCKEGDLGEFVFPLIENE